MTSLQSVMLIRFSCAQTDIAMEEGVSWTLVSNGKKLQPQCKYIVFIDK